MECEKGFFRLTAKLGYSVDRIVPTQRRLWADLLERCVSVFRLDLRHLCTNGFVE